MQNIWSARNTENTLYAYAKIGPKKPSDQLNFFADENRWVLSLHKKSGVPGTVAAVGGLTQKKFVNGINLTSFSAFDDLWPI